MTMPEGEILAAVSVSKTRTGLRIDVELSGADSLVEDLSYLMILEKAVRMKQKEISEEITENERYAEKNDS